MQKNPRKGRPPPDARQRSSKPRFDHMETAMARIAGVNIPTNKRVVIALQYIHGIGAKKAQEITDKVGIPPERRVNQLTDAGKAVDGARRTDRQVGDLGRGGRVRS